MLRPSMPMPPTSRVAQTGSPGEQLVVAGDAGELDHTEFHDHVVDKLLSLALGQHTLVQVALEVDVEEGRDTAHGHGGTVLRLHCAEVAEVEPLAGLFAFFAGWEMS